MIQVAFTLIGGREWFGGYNYQLNLFNALLQNEKERIQICLFLGKDVDVGLLAGFEKITDIKIVKSKVFNKSSQTKRLLKAITFGKDTEALKVFKKNGINVLFESANYYGWQFPIPTIAWIPDFQHRHLKHLFSFFSYWKRELGFKAQISTNRLIMLSSENARQDCEKFYPKSKGNTHVVSFAVPYKDVDLDSKEVLNLYKLPNTFFFLPNQFWKHKNHLCVLEALKICNARGDDIVIATCGKQEDPRDAEYFPHLNNFMTSNGLEDNFRLLGVIPYAHIQVLMRECAALINPSYFEGWSTTVEEAKSFGKAMILSDINVHKEQAAGRAVFFNPKNPEELAAMLSQDKNSSHIDEDSFLLAKKSSNKIKAYANAFANLVSVAHTLE